MTNYIKLDINIPDELQEFLISELDNMEFTGFEEYDNRLVCYIPQTRLSDVDREFIESWLGNKGEDCFIIEESVIEETNWNQTWEQSIRAQTIGNFYVKPTWSEETVPQDKILLEIDPKMAFGTGYHETTRLVLQLLPRYIEQGNEVLDVGTGTGILAIAALKIGAKSALGVDIDEWSFKNAIENAHLNKVEDTLEIREGSLELVSKEMKYDVVLANIDRNTLLQLATDLIHHTQRYLILSGLMQDDFDYIIKHPAFSRLEFLEKEQENEWISLCFKKG